MAETQIPPGSVSLGGPIVTAGGLAFVAGTLDPFIRAFDVETGKELWNAQLPASGAATPMTYLSAPGGKQYLVIAAGGHAKVAEEPQSVRITRNGDAAIGFIAARAGSRAVQLGPCIAAPDASPLLLVDAWGRYPGQRVFGPGERYRVDDRLP